MVVDSTNRESVNELFGFGKKKKEEKKYYAPLTKDECKKLYSIIKKCISSYPKFKSVVSYDEFNESMNDHVSKDKVSSDDNVTICRGSLWDFPGFARDNTEEAGEEIEKMSEKINSDVKESGIKAKVNMYDGDWDDFEISVSSRKPLESMKESVEPVNELFGFGKKEKDNSEKKPSKMPPMKYGFLTEQEFNKCMSIVKKNINKYDILKRVTVYDTPGIYSTYSAYKELLSDDVSVAMFEFGGSNDLSDDEVEKYNKQYNKAFADIKSELEKLPFKVSCETISDAEWDIICINVRKPKEEPVNEVFGLSKKEKEEKAANRKALSDLEFSYDKKFNAFCLSVSSYSVDKLQSMLDKKSAELESAKDEKKSASDRQKKLEAQVKIDYLENVCNRCKAMIKKKKSYEKK